MKTEWDYSNYAEAYLKRPDYSESAIDKMLEYANISSKAKICDIGAGVAHLTLMLASRGYDITAVEPNDEMRKNGIMRTEKFSNIRWFEGIGEDTKQESNSFEMVTFGSSFNVCDRQMALEEASRILISKGSFACMWNHRNLEDPIQKNIEAIIAKNINNYDYGTRREDPTEVINRSELFKDIQKIEGTVIHTQSIEECVEAWRSHATLGRQSLDKFNAIIKEIEEYLNSLNLSEIQIPYTTRIWVARSIK